ncbi:MAG: DUF1259 domain-containing protein [Acidobacteria bacterium]|nr:DUF1259 domain-containing protein [Acidobacteriota bacterium]
MRNGVLRFDLPRSDLHVPVKAFRRCPTLSLMATLRYKQENGGTLLVAELCLLEDEVNPVVSVLKHYQPLGNQLYRTSQSPHDGAAPANVCPLHRLWRSARARRSSGSCNREDQHASY